jgi:hypothetical protein
MQAYCSFQEDAEKRAANEAEEGLDFEDHCSHKVEAEDFCFEEPFQKRLRKKEVISRGEKKHQFLAFSPREQYWSMQQKTSFGREPLVPLLNIDTANAFSFRP